MCKSFEVTFILIPPPLFCVCGLHCSKADARDVFGDVV